MNKHIFISTFHFNNNYWVSVINQSQCQVFDKISTNFFKVKENSVFCKTFDLTFFYIVFCIKISDYYLMKLGVAQQEVESENMLFQDIFVIKVPLCQKIPFPGVKLNEHVKNSLCLQFFQGSLIQSIYMKVYQNKCFLT